MLLYIREFYLRNLAVMYRSSFLIYLVLNIDERSCSKTHREICDMLQDMKYTNTLIRFLNICINIFDRVELLLIRKEEK